MQAYDFGIFNTLKNEFEHNGISRIFPFPVPADAINDNQPYITVNVENIKQAMRLRAQADIELAFHHSNNKFKSSVQAALENVSKHNGVLKQDNVEIGSVCFKSDAFNNEKDTLNIQAFMILKRIYTDE